MTFEQFEAEAHAAAREVFREGLKDLDFRTRRERDPLRIGHELWLILMTYRGKTFGNATRSGQLRHEAMWLSEAQMLTALRGSLRAVMERKKKKLDRSN